MCRLRYIYKRSTLKRGLKKRTNPWGRKQMAEKRNKSLDSIWIVASTSMTSVPLMTPAKGVIEHVSLNSTQLNANYLNKSQGTAKLLASNRNTTGWDTLLELRRSCDDSSSVCILYMPMQQVSQPKNASRCLTRKTPTVRLDRRKKNAEFCRGVQEVAQPFSGGLAKSAALRWQSFMAAMFHLQKGNCALSAQVILPPGRSFSCLQPMINLWAATSPQLLDAAGVLFAQSCESTTECQSRDEDAMLAWSLATAPGLVLCVALYFFHFPLLFPHHPHLSLFSSLSIQK